MSGTDLYDPQSASAHLSKANARSAALPCPAALALTLVPHQIESLQQRPQPKILFKVLPEPSPGLPHDEGTCRLKP